MSVMTQQHVDADRGQTGLEYQVRLLENSSMDQLDSLHKKGVSWSLEEPNKTTETSAKIQGRVRLNVRGEEEVVEGPPIDPSSRFARTVLPYNRPLAERYSRARALATASDRAAFLLDRQEQVSRFNSLPEEAKLIVTEMVTSNVQAQDVVRKQNLAFPELSKALPALQELGWASAVPEPLAGAVLDSFTKTIHTGRKPLPWANQMQDGLWARVQSTVKEL